MGKEKKGNKKKKERKMTEANRGDMKKEMREKGRKVETEGDGKFEEGKAKERRKEKGIERKK